MTGEPRLQGIELGDLVSTLEHLSRRGVTQDHFRRIRSDPGFARRVTKAIRTDPQKKGPILLAEAREIMGEANIFGPEDWEKHFGIRMSDWEKRKLDQFPWGEDVLDENDGGKTVAETHQAFVGQPQFNGRGLTIAEWAALKPIKTLRIQYRGPKAIAAYEDGKDVADGGWFATNETCRWGWYLVRRRPVPLLDGGFDLNWRAVIERRLARTGYEPLKAVEEVTRFILFSVKSGRVLPIWTADHDTAFFPDLTEHRTRWPLTMEQYSWASDPPQHQLLFQVKERHGVSPDDDLIVVSRKI